MSPRRWSWRQWICQKFGLMLRKQAPKPASLRRTRLMLEPLETRLVPSTITVSATAPA